MSYEVKLHPQVQEFLDNADDKTERIVRDNLAKLAEDPYPRPGSGRGDKEKIEYKGQERYRLHISRSYTAIYVIKDDVLVLEIEEIGSAHKNYS